MAEFDADDYRYMSRALSLARRGICSTHPNPRVGCVLVRDGRIVGEGWHRRAGEPHAEVFALAEAGPQAEGCTCYVTLEPCAHQGRTPPCADALQSAGVRRVVAAILDPDPRVAGQGLRRLAGAGVDVAEGLLKQQASDLNRGFLMRMQHGRPWVRLKQAASVDGRTALRNGVSRWISGPAARADVQRLRARSDCILTGVGTVLADDPSLNKRPLPGDPGLSIGEQVGDQVDRQPLRVVIDSALQTPPEARMLTLPGRTLIYSTRSTGHAHGYGDRVDVVPVAADAEGRVSLAAVLLDLAAREINEVHVESGAVLAGALLNAELVDELVVYMAPMLLGSDARAMFELPVFTEMSQRIELRIDDVRPVGRDWKITARPVYGRNEHA